MKRILLIVLISLQIQGASHRSFWDKDYILERLNVLQENLLWTRALDEVPQLDSIISSVEYEWPSAAAMYALASLGTMFERVFSRLDMHYSTDRRVGLLCRSFFMYIPIQNLLHN